MKFYTSSFFAPQNWHGECFGISVSHPPQVSKTLPSLWCFVPPAKLLKRFKKKEITEEQYAVEFRAILKKREKEIDDWLEAIQRPLNINGLDFEFPEVTLLCWEAEGEFCHRGLVAELLKGKGFEVEIH